MTTSSEVRSKFLEFFKSKGHEVVPSASLLPSNDPTLLFTNAGMVPFKDVFTGKEARGYKRATSSQKCIRISGKHNDLENVGVTARHHTFFEMLGNFSFGDYFKEEAIAYAWELLTKEYAIDQNKLVITVFGGDPKLPTAKPDDEARALWKKVTGFSDDRVIGMGAADNFWTMGDTGPCGPCTEIHYFHGDKPDYASFGQEPTPDGLGWMEIWNLVFMQFNRAVKDGELVALPKPCVDTGAGLERVSAVLQGKRSNYDSDLLRALVDKASEISGKPYMGSTGDDDVSMRVIADHARTTAFLIAEGVFPDRAERAYVLRRVMRRAIRHGHRLGIDKPFLHQVAMEVVALMGEQYPELVTRKGIIADVAEQEEVRFRETLARGLKILDEEVTLLKGAGKTELPGKTVFKLHDTYGFPPDLTHVIAAEQSLTVDMAGYDMALKEQREGGKGATPGGKGIDDVWREALTLVQKIDTAGVRFVGYEREAGEGKIVAIVKDGALVGSAAAGDEVSIVTDVTPFYGESGGQVGDQGVIAKEGATVAISDTQKPIAGLFAHVGKITSGEFKVGDAVKLEVDHEKRSATRRNHSATHLLHWALRTVLGETATQKGSLVGPERLRFDFSHGKPVTHEELGRIEDLVNAKVLTAEPVITEVLPQAEARARGAMAIFGEKYGDSVRVLTMTTDSVELCGGTHARSLGEIGLFKVLSEGGLAAGVRRIEATTGTNALGYVRQLEGSLRATAQLVKGQTSEVPEKVEKLLAESRKLEKEIADLKRAIAMGGSGGGGIEDMLRDARDIPGGKAVSVKANASDPAMLREIADKLRDKLGEAVVLVGAVTGPKVSLVVTVSKGLTGRYKAGDIIKKIAGIVGGSGGGRPDMAQAGGTEIGKLDEALAALYPLLS